MSTQSNVLDLPRRDSEGQSLPQVPDYAELLVTSNFSFLRGGSHPEELIPTALMLGLNGLGLCDRNSLAGVVRAHLALRQTREKPEFADAARHFRYRVGVRLVFADGTPDIVVYPSDRDAYGRLCKLLTDANMAGEKGKAEVRLKHLLTHIQGQFMIVMPDEQNWARTRAVLRGLVRLAPGRVWLGAACRFAGTDRARLNRIGELAEKTGAPMLAVNDVLYHVPERRVLQDVVTCIREHMTLFEAGRQLQANAERHLKSPLEMAHLFAEHPDALAQTQVLAGRITFDLDQLQYHYPEETVGTGESAQETLERLTWAGALKRYGGTIPEKVKVSLWSELCLIAYKRYAPYFLTVEDLVRYARDERKIFCQGRGSAANSAVCYCLGITEVNPMQANLVFGRFLSTERDEPPDIDVDFEHERREEVMAYLYKKYGRHRTGLTANVITYRSKGAMREVCKVFGVSEDMVDTLNEIGWGYYSSSPDPKRVRQLGFNPDDPLLAKVLTTAHDLMGFPRHLSQHVGGFVITKDRLDHLIPLSKTAMESRTIVEWNKDDLDALKILKVDVLALGMLSCLRRAFEMLHVHYGKDLTFQDVLGDKKEGDPRVYAMTHRADTIGVFQIESRAQMSMLPRLKPNEFYDLVIEVAIVRPGPIQGGMVHPYLKRRLGFEEPEPVKPELEEVLKRTYGIPLFQEQAMQIAIHGAGFTPAEADGLRRAMATWRRNGKVKEYAAKFMAGMKKKGYSDDFAQRCFKQIEGFGEYGFPESHAASFAVLVYISCWLKCHYPDVFACALLNSQPMGFYQPAQIVRDASEHGVEIHPVDVNLSDLQSRLEPGWDAGDHTWPRHAEMAADIWSNQAIRLGLNFVKGLADEASNLIVARRGAGYLSVRDLWLRTGLSPLILEKLAEADAFSSMGLSRREALWAVKGLMGTDGAETLPLFTLSGPPAPRKDAKAPLPEMAAGEAVVQDYRMLSLSLKAHPVSFLRPMFDLRRTIRAEQLFDMDNGRNVEVAGLVLVRQRPGTAKGVIFATLEDETGIANIVIWNKVFEHYRRVLLGSKLLAVRGPVQREGLVIHVVARELIDMTEPLVRLANGADIGDVVSRADEGKHGVPPPRERPGERQIELLARAARQALPKGRNFH